MEIYLDHTIVYAADHTLAAQEFAEVMGLPHGRMKGADYDFTIVRVNQELALYFMDKDNISFEQHLAFTVDRRSFHSIVEVLDEKSIPFGSSPDERDNRRTDHDFASRGLFWTNRDGCLFEVMTY